MNGLVIAGLIGLGYLFLGKKTPEPTKDPNAKESDLIDIQANKYMPIVKKFAKIHSIPWKGVMALMYASTGYGATYYYKQGYPWGQNRFGIMGMRGEDFDYIKGILKSNLTQESRSNPEISIEYACAFIKIINAKYNEDNTIATRYYLGLEAVSNSGKGDILSVYDFVNIYTSELNRLQTKYPNE